MTKPAKVIIYCRNIIDDVVCNNPREVAAHCANRTRYCTACRYLRQQQSDRACRLRRRAKNRVEKKRIEKPVENITSKKFVKSLRKMVQCKCPCCGAMHEREIWFTNDMNKKHLYRKFCGPCTRRAERLDTETYSISPWLDP